MEQENRDYDPRDEDRDYSDLSDNGRSAIERAQSQWGSAKVINGGYDPSKLEEAENSNTSNNTNNVSEAEKSGNTNGWNTSVSGGTHKSRNNIKNPKKIFSKLKGKGPAISIVSFFGIGGVLVAAIGSLMVSLTPIHLLQNFMQNINFPSVSSRVRINKVFNQNINGHRTTTGVLSKKYGGMSDSMIKRMNDNGIEIITSGEVLPNGMNEVTSIKNTATGDAIDPKDFDSYMASNPDFNAKYTNAISSKWTVLKDKVGSKWRKTFGIKETGIEDPKKSNNSITDEEIDDIIDEKSNNKSANKLEVESSETNGADTNDDGSSSSNDYSSELSEEELPSKSKADSLADELNELADATDESVVDKAVNIIGTLGPVQDLCTVAKTMNVLSKAGRIERGAQAVGFSMTILQVASKIMAGNAGVKEVEKIGKMLTTTYDYGDPNTESGVKKLSAMDSPGIMYAMTGKWSGATSSTTSATIGNGSSNIFGKGVLNNLISLFRGGSTQKACGALNSTAGDVLSLGITFLPIVGSAAKGFAVTAKEGLTLAVQAAWKKTLTSLPMVKSAAWSAVKGVVKQPSFWVSASTGLLSFFADDIMKFASGKIFGSYTEGTDTGEAVTGGFLLSQSANGLNRGNLALNQDQALAYYDLQREQIAQDAEIDRNTRSPFDITSPNTFLGSIVTKSLPYMSSFNQPLSALSSISSMASSSIRSMLPGAYAEDKQSFKNFTSSCGDTIMEDLGATSDPYCNPIMGIPTEYLNTSIQDVISYLESRDLLDESGNPKGKLSEFKSQCIDSTSPYGTYIDEDDQGLSWGSFLGVSGGADAWKKCTASDDGNGWSIEDKSMYALYFQDTSLSDALNTWGEEF